MPWTAPKTFNTGDVLPASDLNTHLRDNLIFLHNRGADLASATSLTITHGFHKVTGTTQIDNINSPTDGHEVALWFTGSLTIRNNGGGTGNIRTLGGNDEVVAAGEIRIFRSDGTVWQEQGAGAVAGVAELADVTFATATAAWDFQSISGDGHLELVVYARTNNASNTGNAKVTFNNDTTANYDHCHVRARSTVVDTSTTNGATGIQVFECPANTASANLFGTIHAVIAHFSNSSQKKSLVTKSGHVEGTGSSDVNWQGYAGTWRSTAAITRVTVTPGGGSFVTDSRATLYRR